jgi:hypothetical protein
MNNVAHNNNQPAEPVNRIILLGASNLTMSLRLTINTFQQHFGGPSEILVAAGHGRSYGQFSQVITRGLPGIITSGLWSQLELSSRKPTYALLTDIGNDILYGVTPAKILAWVSNCVELLQRQSAHIVITNLPITSVECISSWRYQLFSRLFYPSCRLSRDEVVARAKAVHGGLIEIVANKNIELCELAPHWFGPDGIHVLYCKSKAFYQHIVKQFPKINSTQAIVESDQSISLAWKQRPQFAYKTMWGEKYRQQQPSGQLTDNTTVSLY